MRDVMPIVASGNRGESDRDIGDKKARHFRRAKSREENAARNRSDSKLYQFTRACCGNSHTARGDRVGVALAPQKRMQKALFRCARYAPSGPGAERVRKPIKSDLRSRLIGPLSARYRLKPPLGADPPQEGTNRRTMVMPAPPMFGISQRRSSSALHTLGMTVQR
jgi:hypothetical protein